MCKVCLQTLIYIYVVLSLTHPLFVQVSLIVIAGHKPVHRVPQQIHVHWHLVAKLSEVQETKVSVVDKWFSQAIDVDNCLLLFCFIHPRWIKNTGGHGMKVCPPADARHEVPHGHTATLGYPVVKHPACSTEPLWFCQGQVVLCQIDSTQTCANHWNICILNSNKANISASV